MSDPGLDPPGEPLSVSLELVRRARGGDREALDRLLERYGERLRRIVRLRMSHEARRAAESMDVVQETLLVAARKLGDFEPHDHGSLLRWLATIAERQIHDLVERERAGKRDQRRTLRLDPAETGDGVSGCEPACREETPSQVIARRELQDLYDACVVELPPAQRELVLLRDYSLSSWDEIARATGAPSPDAAKELHQRAKKRLREILHRRAPHAFD